MKRTILYFLFATSLYSCKPSKSKLVDLEKAYTDSLEIATRYWQKEVMDNNTLPVNEAVPRNMANAMKMEEFKAIIDSIEWELKKY